MDEFDKMSDQGMWQLYMELDASLGGNDDVPFSYENAKVWAPAAREELVRRFGERTMERVSTFAVRFRYTGEELIELARDRWPQLQRVLGDASLDS